MRINEHIRKCVVFIGVQTKAGGFAPYGTGFLGALPIAAGRWGTYLITARHVIDEIRRTRLPMVVRLNTKAGGSTLGQLNDSWTYHPTIPNCDIAVVSFVASTDVFDFMAVDLANRVLTPPYILANDVGAGDEVFTSGLLVTHIGASKNIPIVRTGNIAAMPEELTDLGPRLGRQEVFLIESRSIGGLSGSPVFLNTPPFRIVGDGKAKDMGGDHREYLLGVNIGLLELGAHADKIPSDEVAAREHFLETMSAGIAVVVPIQRVLEILDTPALKKNRAEVAAELARLASARSVTSDTIKASEG